MRRFRPLFLLLALPLLIGPWLRGDSQVPRSLRGDVLLTESAGHVLVAVDVVTQLRNPDGETDWLFALQREPTAPTVDLPVSTITARLDYEPSTLKIRSPALSNDLILTIETTRVVEERGTNQRLVKGIGLMYEEGDGQPLATSLDGLAARWPGEPTDD